MNTFSEIIQSNTLPTLEDFKSNQEKFFGFSVPFIDGFIERPDVRVSMGINEFMTFVKDNSLDKIIGKVIPYDIDNIIITRKLFEENSDISDFTSVIISDYRLSLLEEEQLDYVLVELDNMLTEEDENCSIDNEQSILHLYNDDEVDDEAEDELEEYNLTTTAKKLLEDIVEYNNSIPEEIFKIPEKIQLNCIINGIIYSTIITNNIQFDPTYALLEILSKYQSKYDSKIKDKIDKDKQLEYEAEQKQLEQKKLHDLFINRILSDNNYTCLTNDSQREIYLEKLFMNQLNDEEYTNLANIAFSGTVLKFGITRYRLREIKNEIKSVALQKGIKLGR